MEFDQTLKSVLAERFRVLVCDEAQWMSRECFEYWRHLWDDRRTDIAIVFVGGGDCYHVLSREPMLLWGKPGRNVGSEDVCAAQRLSGKL
ncbi:ATP-binding protein [Rhodococcus sp. NPDC060086]|uniref:ATP-binding protein n=1 Tax=unclassified Rhodococcus (in: high G+C Gram-positive bacteria) TaxID=192944 RepID=UPI00364758D5